MLGMASTMCSSTSTGTNILQCYSSYREPKAPPLIFQRRTSVKSRPGAPNRSGIAYALIEALTYNRFDRAILRSGVDAVGAAIIWQPVCLLLLVIYSLPLFVVAVHIQPSPPFTRVINTSGTQWLPSFVSGSLCFLSTGPGATKSPPPATDSQISTSSPLTPQPRLCTASLCS